MCRLSVESSCVQNGVEPEGIYPGDSPSWEIVPYKIMANEYLKARATCQTSNTLCVAQYMSIYWHDNKPADAQRSSKKQNFPLIK